MNSERRLLEAVAKLEPDAVEVLADIAARLVKGRDQYGDLNVRTDKRDFDAEIDEECTDIVVYAAMDRLKRRRRGSTDPHHSTSHNPELAGHRAEIAAAHARERRQLEGENDTPEARADRSAIPGSTR